MFNKVLVGVDGHDGGLDAAALARQLVAADGELVLTHIHRGYPLVAKAETELTAIEVLDVPMYIFYSSRPREGMPGQDPLKVVANEISRLGGFEADVRFGYLEDELANASGTVDLLVMGSRSLGRVRLRVETSTSQEIARRAWCPLLVMSEAASQAFDGNGEIDEHHLANGNHEINE
jgi:nucleotide-binding universal stress UspA family protein